MKILVVDDDVEIVREMCSFLSRRGHEAVPATGAKSAAELLARDKFCVVLTDMRMPDGSGLDVLRAANQPGQSPLKFVMTGHATEQDIAEAVKLGAQRIFNKPLSLRSILAALDAPVAA